MFGRVPRLIALLQVSRILHQCSAHESATCASSTASSRISFQYSCVVPSPPCKVAWVCVDRTTSLCRLLRERCGLPPSGPFAFRRHRLHPHLLTPKPSRVMWPQALSRSRPDVRYRAPSFRFGLVTNQSGRYINFSTTRVHLHFMFMPVSNAIRTRSFCIVACLREHVHCYSLHLLQARLAKRRMPCCCGLFPRQSSGPCSWNASGSPLVPSTSSHLHRRRMQASVFTDSQRNNTTQVSHSSHGTTFSTWPLSCVWSCGASRPVQSRACSCLC